MMKFDIKALILKYKIIPLSLFAFTLIISILSILGLPTFKPYIYHVLTICLFFTIITCGLNIISGYAGQLNFGGIIVYVGFGAYTTALLTMDLGFPPFQSMIVGILTAWGIGTLLGVVACRIRGFYFGIVTILIGLVFYMSVMGFSGLTEGMRGITGIPDLKILGFVLSSPGHYLLLTTILAILAFAVMWKISSSSLGLIFKGIRENEDLLRSRGANTYRFKILAFSLSALLCGIVGGLYPFYYHFVHPEFFVIPQSILAFLYLVMGGMGTENGPVVGSFLGISIVQIYKYFGGNYILFLGLTLVLFMIFLPKGIFGALTGRSRSS